MPRLPKSPPAAAGGALDPAVEAEAVGLAKVWDEGPRAGGERLKLDCYERARRVCRLLRRWEHGSRDAARLVSLLSQRVAASNRLNRQPQMFQNLVNLVVDVEQLLMQLPLAERQVVLEIALDERGEEWLGRKLRRAEKDIAGIYWRAIRQLEEWLVEGGYLEVA